MVNTFSDTNYKERLLLIIGGWTTLGKVFQVSRAFLSNQCSWVFQWIFSFFMPTIYCSFLKKQTLLFVMVTNSCVTK